MKIWISCDMEGVAGIVDWDQCRPGSSGYALGCELLQDEVNAAIEGAVAGGATEIVVNDSHSRMANLDPRKIAGGASYLSGRHKPMYMVEGLDDSFDAVFLVGYHGSISGRPSTLSHTYNPEVFAGVRVNGEYVGESGINALPMAHFGTPVAFVSGDLVTAEGDGAVRAGCRQRDHQGVHHPVGGAEPAPGRVVPADPRRRGRSGPPGRGGKRAGARDRQAGDAGHGVPDR